MRILLSAYACEPETGSEPGLGWNWAIELAQQGHDVWVLTRENNRQAIESETAKLQRARQIHYIYYDLPEKLRPWKKGARGIYLYYFLWQLGAFYRAKKKHKLQKFDLVHHVSFSSFRQPSFMGSLGIPFVFGPVGGGETAPRALRKGYGPRGWLLDLIRDVSNIFVQIDPLMYRTFKQAERIWTTTPQTARAIPKIFRHKTDTVLSIAIDDLNMASEQYHRQGGKFKILYAGQCIYWKGMHIGIHAFAKLVKKFGDVQLTLIGEGPEKKRWQGLAHQLGVEEKVHWQGRLPTQEELFNSFAEYDLFLFPSLHDSGGMVVLEAMACGLPVVCLDLGGPGVIVNETCGKKIPVKNLSLDQVAGAVAVVLHQLATDRKQLVKLRHGALKRVEDFTWEKLVKKVYANVLQKEGGREIV